MSDIAERRARISAQFTERVRAVPADAWNNPPPCQGWTALADPTVAAMGAMPGETLRAGAMSGPRIDRPADADDQTRFPAFAGRRA